MKKFNIKCMNIHAGKIAHVPFYAENVAEAIKKLNDYGEGRLVALSCEEVPIEDYFKEMEAKLALYGGKSCTEK